MTEATSNTDSRSRLTLSCYDGSEGSHQALQSAAEILGPRKLVVLTVWQSVATQMLRAGGFGGLIGGFDEEDADRQEQQAAQQAADEGVARARTLGFDATSRVEQATVAVWRSIIDVADEIDAEVILCGTRGRGTVGVALLGSTSHGVLHHTQRPVLIAPEAPLATRQT